MRVKTRLIGEESGETMISFAMVFPILFGLMFGVMQLCLAYYNYERISELAREGTRYAMLRGSTCKLSTGTTCTVATSDITTYVNAVGLPNLGDGTVSVTPSYPDGDEVPGHRVQVVVSYSYPYTIPFMSTMRFRCRARR